MDDNDQIVAVAAAAAKLRKQASQGKGKKGQEDEDDGTFPSNKMPLVMLDSMLPLQQDPKKQTNKLKQGLEKMTKKLKKEEEVDEDGEQLSLALALTKMVGRLEGMDVAKEIYIALLGRQHPFPFCAWQVIFDPNIFTPVLLDTNSVYRLQALHFRTRNDVFRITGHFPKVRYFSFQVMILLIYTHMMISVLSSIPHIVI